MSQAFRKGPFAALTIESSKNFILTYFQKPMWFYLLATKISLRENFIPMRNALDRSYRDRYLILNAINCVIFYKKNDAF